MPVGVFMCLLGRLITASSSLWELGVPNSYDYSKLDRNSK